MNIDRCRIARSNGCGDRRSSCRGKNCSLLQVYVRKTEGFLTVVFDLKFVFLVEFDLADGRELARPFATLVHVEDNDAKLIIGRAASVIQFTKRHRTVGDHDNVEAAVRGW